MSKTKSAADDSPELEFELIRDDLPLRLMRKIGIVPGNGLGAIRRAIFFTLLCWVPLMLWAFFSDRLSSFAGGPGLLDDVGIHVRCLIAIPALILAEAAALVVGMRIFPHFVSSGVVTAAQHGQFRNILRDVARLRDSSLPWVMVIGITIAWVIGNPTEFKSDPIFLNADGGAAFGGMWLLYFVRPVFIALLLGWLWRIALVVILFSRIAKLDLALVPSHPDRAAGLGFLEGYPAMFSLVSLGLSGIIAGGAYQSLTHGASLASLKLALGGFVVVWLVVVLMPLLLFIPQLKACKRQALRDYGALVGAHGRLVRQRWILGEKVEDAPVLDAPELGPVADINAIFDAVKAMRTVLIGKASIMPIIVPILVPMVVVAATQMPVKDVLMKLAKILI